MYIYKNACNSILMGTLCGDLSYAMYNNYTAEMKRFAYLLI